MNCENCEHPIINHSMESAFFKCGRCGALTPVYFKGSKFKKQVVKNLNEHIKYENKQDELFIGFSWYRTFDLTNPIFEEDIFDDGESLFWGFLGYLFNKTKIQIDSKYIQIKHGPIDGMAEIYFRVNRVNEIYVRETDRSVEGIIEKREIGLYAKINNGDEELLLWGLTEESLNYMAQRISNFLDPKTANN